MVCQSIDHGNDVTGHAVPVVLFLVFRKNILLLNMEKEEPIFNIWGEISVSELVLEAAKVEQKYEKQREKRRCPSVVGGRLATTSEK